LSRRGERVAQPEQITGKDNLSSVLRQERKTKKRAVGDSVATPKRQRRGIVGAFDFILRGSPFLESGGKRNFPQNFPKRFPDSARRAPT
jgi:hypothetical protein